MSETTYIRVTDIELSNLNSNRAAKTDAFYIVPSGKIYKGQITGVATLFTGASIDPLTLLLTTTDPVLVAQIKDIVLPDIIFSGTFGNETNAPQITIDAKGRMVGVKNISIKISESQVTNLSTDLTNINNAIATKENAFVTNTISTTTNAVTTISTIALTASTTTFIDAYVVARRTGGAVGTAEDGLAVHIEGGFKMVGGVATQIGTTTIVSSAKDQAGWGVIFTPTAGNVLIQINGANANLVDWEVWYKIRSVG